jgi:hypothetical protein
MSNDTTRTTEIRSPELASSTGERERGQERGLAKLSPPVRAQTDDAKAITAAIAAEVKAAVMAERARWRAAILKQGYPLLTVEAIERHL